MPQVSGDDALEESLRRAKAWKKKHKKKNKDRD